MRRKDKRFNLILRPSSSNIGRTVSQLEIDKELDLAVYDIFRKYVEHEDDLVNHRISWMLVIHGFLYAAYAFTIQQKFSILSKIFKIQTSNDIAIPYFERLRDSHEITGGLPYYLSEAIGQTEFFLILIAFIGFTISLVALRSINAAKNAAVNVQKVFEGQFEIHAAHGVHETVLTKDNLVLPTIAGGGDNRNRLLGILSARRIPFVLMGGWVISFVMEVLSIICYLRH
jgi:hypothetical protein